MRAVLAAALLAAPLGLAAPARAQDAAGEAVVPQARTAGPEAQNAPGGVLRGLDKVTGRTRDLELAEGETARLGLVSVTLGECRYPSADPASNAYAWVTVVDPAAEAPVFSGWMIAAAPALNALDHPRYDIWLIRCSIPEG